MWWQATSSPMGKDTGWNVLASNRLRPQPRPNKDAMWESSGVFFPMYAVHSSCRSWDQSCISFTVLILQNAGCHLATRKMETSTPAPRKSKVRTLLLEAEVSRCLQACRPVRPMGFSPCLCLPRVLAKWMTASAHEASLLPAGLQLIRTRRVLPVSFSPPCGCLSSALLHSVLAVAGHHAHCA
jgi:hypothetical protein